MGAFPDLLCEYYFRYSGRNVALYGADRTGFVRRRTDAHGMEAGQPGRRRSGAPAPSDTLSLEAPRVSDIVASTSRVPAVLQPLISRDLLAAREWCAACTSWRQAGRAPLGPADTRRRK